MKNIKTSIKGSGKSSFVFDVIKTHVKDAVNMQSVFILVYGCRG